MKVLVTGGAGFIGSHIVDGLIADGYEVVVIDNLSTGKKENLNKLAKFYEVDIREAADLHTVFTTEKPDYVIHHAAQIDVQTSLKLPALDAMVNIVGTINLLQLCVQFAVKKIVYASSAAVYGDPDYLGVDEKHKVNPMSFYGISKHTPEHYIQAFSGLSGLRYSVLRYANVYGIRQDPKGEGGVVSIFLDRLLNNQAPFIFGDGEQTRDFIYVADIARANILALEKGDQQILNIGCNTQTTVNQLFSMMSEIMGKNIKPIYQAPRLGDIVHSFLNNELAKAELGWEPQYNLGRGLEETITYYAKK